MVIVLRDGEEVHGYIQWYDKSLHQAEPQRLRQPDDLQARHQVHVQGRRGVEEIAVSYQLSAVEFRERSKFKLIAEG